MKKYALILALLIQVLFTTAQTNFNKEWIVGFRGYQVKFNNTTITHDTIIFPPDCYFENGSSSICDSAGNIILACDGMDLVDSLGVNIEDGDSLTDDEYYIWNYGSSRYHQSSIILPMQNKKYYLVTPSCNDTMLSNHWLGSVDVFGFNVLYYHVIDMNANGGAGKVVKRKQAILENRYMDKTQMMACQHANGKDWWLFKKAGIVGGDSNFIYSFLFKQDSVINMGVQILPFPRNEVYKTDIYGQMQFNQQGTQMATIVANGLNELYIADFDRCHGQLSNHKKINVPALPGDSTSLGLAYSPNGRFLYVVKYYNILQYDLQDPDSATAWYHVAGIDTTISVFMGYTSAFLGHNHRIYFGHFHGFSQQMSAINNPDNKGAACGFCPKCLHVQSSTYFISPPSMPNYDLGALTPCWPLSTEQYTKENLLLLYPNPTRSKLYIKNKIGKAKHLYNTVGELLTSTNADEIDLGCFGKGVYILKCEGTSKKVMVE